MLIQIKEENDILFINQMTEPCTKIIKHGLQSSFLTISTSARGGYEYFVTFIDDYSRYGYIYLMHHKSETFEKFKEFKAKVENHRGKSIKSLRYDRGGEYLLGEFRQFLEDHGITSHMSAPGQPQQNGVTERRNRTLLDIVRSMMSYESLPSNFWGYALGNNTVYSKPSSL